MEPPAVTRVAPMWMAVTAGAGPGPYPASVSDGRVPAGPANGVDFLGNGGINERTLGTIQGRRIGCPEGE
jgi:hypothetical protein